MHRVVRRIALNVLQVEGSPDKASAVTALGTLQNLAAESAANKDAIREAGGVPILVTLLETAPDAPVHLLSCHALHSRVAVCTQ